MGMSPSSYAKIERGSTNRKI
ncbi:hypothetical protein K8P00_06460 [Eikenella corrodens]|nr:hypothetical protein K8P00_06460 [Eikenella corrodens]